MSRNMAWNRAQVLDRNLQLSFVENAVLAWAHTNTTDRRFKTHGRRVGWALELSGSRQITLNFTTVGENRIQIQTRLPTKKLYNTTMDDESQMKTLIEMLRSQENHHVRLIGRI